MTREAINELKKYVLGKKNTEKVEISVLQLNRVIKALEQEPILDKIQDELHATAEMHEDGDYYLREEWIDEIIDKYKVEGEEQHE